MTPVPPRTPTTPKPSRWPLSPQTVRAVLAGHSVLGLAFAGIIYLVCLTGTLAVFTPDIARLEVSHAPALETISDRAIDTALRAATRLAPADATFYASLPGPARRGATVTAYTPAFERTWAIAADGTLVPFDARWSEFLIDLHIDLHLPRRIGAFLVGLTGVALLSSLVSGVLAHPRIVRDAFHLRLGGSRRLQEADWHNRLGVWALPFHFVLALTGALLGLSTVIVAGLAMLLYRGDTARVYDLFVEPPLASDARRVPLTDLAPLLARVRRETPEATPQNLILEHPGRADMRLTVSSGRARLLAQQDEVRFGAEGQILKQHHPRDLAAGTRILASLGQLHFGWFAGFALRLAYGLLGLALCVVTSTGVTIWLARRRDRGRAAPGFERVWSAVCWGQPAILAASGALALAWP
ncbi:PepSY domain-containing protein, partial [Novosphingobium sp. 1949]